MGDRDERWGFLWPSGKKWSWKKARQSRSLRAVLVGSVSEEEAVRGGSLAPAIALLGTVPLPFCRARQR